ncbi:MAG: hypothetical protein IJT32_05520 [Lachnospiraceae bacterium]|nr:hypothetical protein [Lachnospiraceae bacterium]
MLKPLIVILPKVVGASNRPSYIADHFMGSGFYPILCGYEVAQIAREKDNVDNILVALPNVVDDGVRQVLFYLRDMCIDEEKGVFLCGGKDSLKKAKRIIPAMILMECYEIVKGEMDYVASQMGKAFTRDGIKPGCLILDDDLEYNQKLRLALREYCDVAFSDGTPSQTMPYIGQTNLLIISMDMKMDMLAWARIRAMIGKNKNRADFHSVFIANDFRRQIEVTRYLGENSGVCLSKETDFVKNANYLKQRYFS